MNSLEERADELTALESIYEGRLTIVGQKEGCQKFSIDLEDQGDSQLYLMLAFEYTPDYPKTGPLYRITKHKNLSEFDISEISTIIDSVINRSLGYIMIFDILSEVQEKLNCICDNREKHAQDMAKQQQREAELLEEAKFQGDRVTIESFNTWNTRFLAEMQQSNCAQAAVDESALNSKNKKLTGRELFLKDDRYNLSDLTFLDSTEAQVTIDEQLFADINDLDLDLDEST